MVLNGIKRLDVTDLEKLKKLVSSKAAVSNVEIVDLAVALRYRHIWIEGMTKWYLEPQNQTHWLYGYYQEDELISCMSWRCGLEPPWQDGWVVGNLKSTPGYSVRTNGMLLLWEKMFEICDGLGLTKWHMVIPESNSRRYQSVADRYFKEIDALYDYEWTMIVPPKTKPDVEWVWGTMGRFLLNNEIRVRTGTKKQL